MQGLERWQEFLRQLEAVSEVTLVGPFAAPRKEWPSPAIFVDSGTRHRGGPGLQFSVGDGDSAPTPLDLELPQEKDYSDLAFVLRSLPPNLSRLSMVGFLGGRRDHEMINFGEIHRFLRDRRRPTECDLDWSICAFGAGEWTLDFKGIFSLLAFEPILLKLKGDCHYKLETATRVEAFSSHGLSNDSWGLVEIETSGPIFIFKNPFT